MRNANNRVPNNGSIKHKKTYVQTTDEFIEFVGELGLRFMAKGVKNLFFKEKDNLHTYCERVRVNESLISESVIIQSDKFYLRMSPINDGVHIYLLRVEPIMRNMGVGGSVMKLIRSVSNGLNIPVYLIPVPLGNDNVGYEVLQSFYHNHGYKREKTSRYWKYEPNTIQDNLTESYSMVA